MLEWSIPEAEDEDWINSCIAVSGTMASDASFANIYLLRNKYSTRISRYKDFIIRKYSGKGARCGYTFPLGKGDVAKALAEIEKDAKECGERLQFAFVTEEQKEVLENAMPARFCYSSDAGDSDYIYLRSELASLSGKAFHKKKNHFSKFVRTYPDYKYYEIGACNIYDAQKVADAWYYEHLQDEDASQLAEYKAIKEALDNFEELGLIGGIIYVNDSPCAMTIASKINENTVDVHFEKAVGEYALNGGYAAINKLFSEKLDGVTWLNREEDIGIEGLRKAKLSYRPKIMLKKYSAVEK
ncbi:putative uncharacterized protein [Eubacterium sp. CAG:86]|nr:putative uncharacterized protein [Eubacterium sp. CAG:86]